MRPLLACLGLVLTVGCIERTETIEIDEDGAARLTTVVRGDPGDVENGEALPTKATGWQAEERTETDAEGKQTVIRTATRKIDAGSPLPSSYAPEGSRSARLGLGFPTTVRMERADGGMYYHFRREYGRRAWWSVEYLRQRAFENDEIKRLGAMDPKTLSEAERATLVDTFAGYAAEEMGAFLDMALAAMTPPIEQRPFLDARRGGMAVYRDRQLASQVVALLTEDATIRLEPLEQEVRARARDAATVSLRDAKVPEERVKAFLDSYETVRETYEATKDLSDETWRVIVRLPGTVVAHNGIEAESAGDTVVWRFDGKAFFDRDLVLMATSFVPPPGKSEIR